MEQGTTAVANLVLEAVKVQKRNGQQLFRRFAGASLTLRVVPTKALNAD